MDARTLSRTARLGAAVVALVLFAPRESLASSSFPEEIKNQLAMQCAPPCTICHRTLEGGQGTTDKQFAAAMVLTGGLMQQDTATVAPALTAVETAGTDSDGDMVGDIAELRSGHDPNVAAVNGAGDELLCGPLYGCGARVAPRTPLDGSALALALIAVGYLALRSRRRA